MNRCASRLIVALLGLLLSGVAEPAALLAQQDPIDGQIQQAIPAAEPQSAQPSAADSQEPTSSTDAQPSQRQSVEDKASQEILNRNHLPDSPGVTQAPSQTTVAAPGQVPAAPKDVPAQPSGTAAAEAGKVSGNAASRPAGAAIAPAKQRQVRSFLIKLGVLAGAGIAIGTVAALSKASPATPPGAR